MRLFIGVEASKEVMRKISPTIESFMKKGFHISYVPQENLHFTVKFLGEVGDGMIDGIKKGLAGAVEGMKPFRLEVEGLRYFGSENFIRVLWIGAGKGKKEMESLITRVNSSLSYIRKDELDPSPHMTIGRVFSGWDREPILEMIKENAGMKFGGMLVEKVTLFQSIMHPKGQPEYNSIAEFKLNG